FTQCECFSDMCSTQPGGSGSNSGLSHFYCPVPVGVCFDHCHYLSWFNPFGDHIDVMGQCRVIYCRPALWFCSPTISHDVAYYSRPVGILLGNTGIRMKLRHAV